MNKNRVRETMAKGMSRRPLETDRLKSWEMNRMAKEREKRIQPYASSPSFKKDFTFNEAKKQKRIPKRIKTSKSVGKKPEKECAAILLEEPANASGTEKTAVPSKSHTLKKDFDPFLFIFFSKSLLISNLIAPTLMFWTAPLLTHIFLRLPYSER